MSPSKPPPHRFRIRVTALVIAAAYAIATTEISAESPAQAGDTHQACATNIQESFLRTHQAIQEIGTELRATSDQALRLHRKPRFRPYKRIEVAWAKVKGDSESALDALSSVSVTFDAMRDDTAKRAALDLASTYHAGLLSLLDYGESVVGFERTENTASVIAAKQTVNINFSLPRSKARTAVDNLERQYMDWRSLQIGDVSRSIKLPEYRYGKLCSTAFFEPMAGSINACALTASLREVRKNFIDLDTKAVQAGEIVARLHHTSRWRPYVEIEHAWRDTLTQADPLLDTLYDAALRLDETPDSEPKAAAIALLSTYRDAIHHIVNYMHWVVYEERTENLVSLNIYPQTLSFGVIRDGTKNWVLDLTRQFLDSRVLEAEEALLSTNLSEHHYAKVCAEKSAQGRYATVGPCAFTQQFVMLHNGVLKMGKEAEDIGNGARYLHHTSSRRPYKRIERSWSDVSTQAKSLVITTTDLLVALDNAPANPRKTAAIDLDTAYQNAFDAFVDYAHYAVFLERVENFASMQFVRDYLTFGVMRQPLSAVSPSYSRQLFDAKFAEADDALRSARLPEHRYVALCHATFSKTLSVIAKAP